jgi:GTP cyclohydrolase I
MHNGDKSDAALGKLVNEHLKSLGLETPVVKQNWVEGYPTYLEKDRIDIIAQCFKRIMTEGLNLDLNDDSMRDTPNRLGKMFVNEIFWGLNYDNFPKCTAIKNTMSHHDTHGSFVLERNVNVMSTCEHHFVPIDGKACVAYIPKDKVLGLSKLNRIVEFYSKRPQVQERLTEQIRAALAFVAETDNVAVYIDAAHFCVKTRGIQDVGSSTVTLSVGGMFAEDKSDIRREFLNLARMP